MVEVIEFRENDPFTVMVYAKFTIIDNLTNFVNIDWQTVNHNKNIANVVSVKVDQTIYNQYYGSQKGNKLFFAKSTKNDDLLIINNSISDVSHIFDKSPIIQFGDDVYYVPFLQFKKMLEVSLVNIDQLPQDKLKELYISEIVKVVDNKKSQKDLGFDINNPEEGKAKHFYYQDQNDPMKLVFGKLYLNRILTYYMDRCHKNINGRKKWNEPYLIFNVFNSYFKDLLSEDEYANLDYLNDYNDFNPYHQIYHNGNRYPIIEDSMENRIKLHIINDVFDTRPLYYDYYGDCYIYTNLDQTIMVRLSICLLLLVSTN